MSSQNVISGNVRRNNGATIVKGGDIDSTATVTNVTTTQELGFGKDKYGSKVILADSVTLGQSGNLGTFKPLDAGVFADMEKEQYVAKILGTRIAQTDNNFLRSGAADVGLRRQNIWPGYQRLDISDWSYTTGAATFGANRGVTVLPSGIDGTTGRGADAGANPTDAVPGQLVYMETGKIPTQDNYKPRTG